MNCLTSHEYEMKMGVRPSSFIMMNNHFSSELERQPTVRITGIDSYTLSEPGFLFLKRKTKKQEELYFQKPHFDDSEVDVEKIDAKLQNQNNIVQETLNKVQRTMKIIDPFIKDLKDGSL